eukprot:NODE_9134_length_1445_cov_2.229894.p1 GENE.NODE_9134_length_1445_cov_2.229894~~NODE_9134_length_1445_cov_2.229894.p1  ORF type:complete len:298 (-),score=122.23 NODE_9134_length_1445_cov_2.229894:551-1330(-)
MLRATRHYRFSLWVVPTAEVWHNAGVCAYRIACRARDAAGSNGGRRGDGGGGVGGGGGGDAVEPVAPVATDLFHEALALLTEANLLDPERPQISAWLAVCAAETGQVQVTRQTLRQVLRFEDRLGYDAAIELARVLLRCGDICGRYAREAVQLTQIARARSDTVEACLLLAQGYENAGEDKPASTEYRSLLARLDGEPALQDEVLQAAEACAARLLAAPQWAALVRGDCAAVLARRSGDKAAAVASLSSSLQTESISTA